MPNAVNTEMRVIGPPGTGKTTFLSREVERSLERYGDDALLLTSLTRAAAAELAGRGLPVERERIGTLHAHCYRALRRPQLVEKHLGEWNEHHDVLRLSAGSTDVDESPAPQDMETAGDKARNRYDLLRAELRPRAVWPPSVLEFARAFEAWKDKHGYLDFTDLISTALADVPAPPLAPRMMMLDEAQDMSALEMALARQWGQHVERLYVVGDPDQAIFTWRGADPGVFQSPPLPEAQMRVLSQSHRVPRAVHALASRWIARLPGRLPVQYRPRDDEGQVRRLGTATWKYPDPLLMDIERALDAGRRVMVLASCAYHLGPMLARLRAAGVPFHNPYRRARGDWNPLRTAEGDAKRVSTAARLLDFLRLDAAVWGEQTRMWNPEDLRRWTALLRQKGVLRTGGAGRITAMTTRAEVPVEVLHELFEDDALEQALDLSLAWLESSATAERRRALTYPVAMVRRWGGSVLREEPRLVVGTIHSVKGGESDVVYLLPDLSRAGMEGWMSAGAGRDSVLRLFYVGMTRAREELVLCGAAGRSAVTW